MEEGATEGSPDSPHEEVEEKQQVKGEEVEEKQQVRGEEVEEEEDSKISDQRDRRAEEAVDQKKNETRRVSVEKLETKEEVLKSPLSKEGKDKEPSKKPAFSSFFGQQIFAQLSVLQPGSSLSSHISCFVLPTAPRKAAVKMEKPDKHEGEKKMNAERKTSAEEDEEVKW